MAIGNHVQSFFDEKTWHLHQPCWWAVLLIWPTAVVVASKSLVHNVYSIMCASMSLMIVGTWLVGSSSG
jgi:hypothetical protein